MSKKLKHHTLGDIEVGTYMFYDVKVARIHINGTAYMTALDVGRALGYEEPRHVLKHMDVLDAHRYIVIKHSNFKWLKRVLAESGLSTFNKFAPSAILVTQSGAETLAMVSRTVRGSEFRHWIVDVVLPAYRAQAAAQSSNSIRVWPLTLEEQRDTRLK